MCLWARYSCYFSLCLLLNDLRFFHNNILDKYIRNISWKMLLLPIKSSCFAVRFLFYKESSGPGKQEIDSPNFIKIGELFCELLKPFNHYNTPFLNTYIIGHYNPSIRIIELVSPPLMLCVLILYISGGTCSRLRTATKICPLFSSS